MKSLFLQTAPPLDPAWLAFEEEFALNKPRQELPIAEHQAAYAAECRSLNAKMLAPGARDDHLSLNVTKTEFTVPSTLASPSVDEANRYQIPVIRYEHATTSPANDSAAPPSQAQKQPDITVLYIHGGGLYVGEADSKELSCLRILKATSVPTTKNVNDTNKSHLIKDVYSLTYRLMPTYSAQDSLSDCLSVLNFIPQPTPTPAQRQQEQQQPQTHPSRKFLRRTTRRPPLPTRHCPWHHHPRRPPPLSRNQRRLQRPGPLRAAALSAPAHQRLASFLLELAVGPDEAGGCRGTGWRGCRSRQKRKY